MRNRRSGLARVIVLAVTMATGGCSSHGAGTSSDAGGGTNRTGSEGGTSSGGGSTSGGEGSSGGSSSGGTEDCGDGGVTTVCGSLTLGALTTVATTQLCNDTAAYFARTVSTSVACKWSALSTSASCSSPTDMQLQACCAQQENPCVEAGAGMSAGVGGSADCLGTIPGSCTATVAQYEACISDETSALLQTVSALPDCPTLTMSDITNIQNAQTANPPASCAAVNACSGVSAPDPLQNPMDL